MASSKQIAGLIGPILVAMNLSEALNPHIWATVPPTQTYLAGLLWFVAGFSIVRVHNCWKREWFLLITLTGWFFLLGGLGRMFFPEPVQQGSYNAVAVLTIQMILLAIGIFLIFKAYSRENNKASSL